MDDKNNFSILKKYKYRSQFIRDTWTYRLALFRVFIFYLGF